MAIYLPIVSEFKSDGIDRAKKEFKSLEGFGAKASYAIKKAAVPATAALAGMAAVLADATKSAIEDAAAQSKLAAQLERSTGATNAEIQAVEDWIAAQGQLRAYSDDQLRPAISKLATTTGDMTEAQKLATLAMDIATATGKPLDSVVTQLSKAYGGNTMALAKLDPALREIIKSGASTDEVMGLLTDTFGGAASEAAGTAEGSFARMTIAMNETKESIGAALLPVVQAVLPYLQSFAQWAQNNPNAFLAIAGTISAVAAAIVAVNVAMALNPFALIAAGIAALVVGLGVAYRKFEGFRNVVNSVMNGIISYFEALANAWRLTINLVIRGINLVKPGPDIPMIGEFSFGRVGGGADSTGGGGRGPLMMAEGGIVTGPVNAIIGEAGPEAVIPLDRMGEFGGNQITVNVNGADPNAVVAALRRYVAQSGPVPIRVTG